MENSIATSWNIDPGKWPRLVVTGHPITPEQADHLLIRTAPLHYLDCNDREWNRIVARIVFGDETLLRYDNPWRYEQIRIRSNELHVLPLWYLRNHQISGLPRGWCDWAGRIGSAGFNVGKWPTFEEVGAEWAQIAAAFPYLDLTAQLVSDEGGGELCAQWRIKDGVAVAEELGAPLATPEQLCEEGEAMMDGLIGRIVSGDVHEERGVSADRLQQAVERVEEWATAP